MSVDQIFLMNYILKRFHSFKQINSEYTCIVGDKIGADTSSGSFTIYLPAVPYVGATVDIVDFGRSMGSNNLIVNGNGKKIKDSLNPLALDTNGSILFLAYVSEAYGWGTVTDSNIVTSLNGMTGDLSILEGDNVTLEENLTNKSITINCNLLGGLIPLIAVVNGLQEFVYLTDGDMVFSKVTP